MALVTLGQAKDHLRITDADHDADIGAKLDQAEAIVLKHLKHAGTFAVIESSSVANPTVITTSTPHGFANGNTVIIAGHTDSVPNLNASWTISNVLNRSFTVPTGVTTAGTGGSAAVAWTDTTVPQPIISAILLMLEGLYEHAGDLTETWTAVERLTIGFRDPALA